MPSKFFHKGQKEAIQLLTVLTPGDSSFQEKVHINVQRPVLETYLKKKPSKAFHYWFFLHKHLYK